MGHLTISKANVGAWTTCDQSVPMATPTKPFTRSQAKELFFLVSVKLRSCRRWNDDQEVGSVNESFREVPFILYIATMEGGI